MWINICTSSEGKIFSLDGWGRGGISVPVQLSSVKREAAHQVSILCSTGRINVACDFVTRLRTVFDLSVFSTVQLLSLQPALETSTPNAPQPLPAPFALPSTPSSPLPSPQTEICIVITYFLVSRSGKTLQSLSHVDETLFEREHDMRLQTHIRPLLTHNNHHQQQQQHLHFWLAPLRVHHSRPTINCFRQCLVVKLEVVKNHLHPRDHTRLLQSSAVGRRQRSFNGRFPVQPA